MRKRRVIGGVAGIVGMTAVAVTIVLLLGNRPVSSDVSPIGRSNFGADQAVEPVGGAYKEGEAVPHRELDGCESERVEGVYTIQWCWHWWQVADNDTERDQWIFTEYGSCQGHGRHLLGNCRFHSERAQNAPRMRMTNFEVPSEVERCEEQTFGRFVPNRPQSDPLDPTASFTETFCPNTQPSGMDPHKVAIGAVWDGGATQYQRRLAYLVEIRVPEGERPMLQGTHTAGFLLDR